MKLFIYYRISDKGRPKEKLPQGDKFSCLRNAICEFGVEHFFVIADNCLPETIQFIQKHGISYETTSLGNSASFMYMIDKIIQKHAGDDYVYLLEDDYIHLPESRKVLLEGLSIADYVTLYDHPDKYRLESNDGNPFNYKKLQKIRLYVTESSHWREINSATMTFACRVKTLKDDYAIWKKHTQSTIPDDFHAFMTITQNSLFYVFLFFFRRAKREFLILLNNFITGKKTKKLVSAVPGMATHAELQYLAPVIDWSKCK